MRHRVYESLCMKCTQPVGLFGLNTITTAISLTRQVHPSLHSSRTLLKEADASALAFWQFETFRIASVEKTRMNFSFQRLTPSKTIFELLVR